MDFAVRILSSKSCASTTVNFRKRGYWISDRERMLGEDRRGPDFVLLVKATYLIQTKGTLSFLQDQGHTSIVKCFSLEDSLIQKHPRNKTHLIKKIPEVCNSVYLRFFFVILSLLCDVSITKIDVG